MFEDARSAGVFTLLKYLIEIEYFNLTLEVEM